MIVRKLVPISSASCWWRRRQRPYPTLSSFSSLLSSSSSSDDDVTTMTTTTTTLPVLPQPPSHFGMMTTMTMTMTSLPQRLSYHHHHHHQQHGSSLRCGNNIINITTMATMSTTTTTTRRSMTTTTTTSSSSSDNNTTFPDNDDITHTNMVDVDAALEKLFAESANTTTTTTTTDAWYQDGTTTTAIADGASASTAVVDWIPVWYSFSDQAIVAVKYVHVLTGLPYGWSIVASTIILRVALFPVMVQSQRTTSRMAHLQPELNLMKQRYEAMGGGTPSRQEQVQFGNNMRQLFQRYQVNPINALWAPIIQLPLFLGMFFGLKQMPHIYAEEFSVGGMFWFVDLTLPDPYYILPVASAGTFLGLIEMGKKQMLASQSNPQTGELMLNVFRFLSIMMLPVCINFEASMLCYWTTNNIVTMIQTSLLQHPSIKKLLGIWELPKPIPGTALATASSSTLMDSISQLSKKIQGEPTTDKERIQRHNEAMDAKRHIAKVVRATRDRRRGATRGSGTRSTTGTK